MKTVSEYKMKNATPISDANTQRIHEAEKAKETARLAFEYARTELMKATRLLNDLQAVNHYTKMLIEQGKEVAA